MKELSLICLLLAVMTVTASRRKGCQLKADVVFIIDSSRSIWEYDYKLQLKFLSSLARELNVGPEDTHVGALSFSEEARAEFYLNEITNVKQLRRRIEVTPFMLGDATNTHKALRMARQEMFSPTHGARQGVPQIIIIVTDGNSTNRIPTREEAQLLRHQGIKVYVVGIGDLDPEQLGEIATQDNDVYVHCVGNFDKLKSLLNELVPATCKAVTTAAPQRQTTPPPEMMRDEAVKKDEAEKKCTTKKADVVFVLDKSSSITYKHFRTQLSFVNEVIDVFTIAPDHTHISVVTFDYDAKLEFGLGQFHSKSEIQKAVLKIQYTAGATNTFLALEKVATEVLTPAGGARKGVAHVVIVVTDGKSSDLANTAHWAETLKQGGAYVFAIGVGNDYDKQELVSIASDPASNYVFQVKQGYDALGTIQNLLAARTCVVPSSDLFVRCKQNARPADVMFSTYYARAGMREVERVTELVKNVAGGIMTSEGVVRVGAVSSDCPDQVDVSLNHSSSAAHFAEALDYRPQQRLATVLRRGREQLTVRKLGARDNVARVNVVLAHGPVSDEAASHSEVMRAKHKNVKFIFVGMGPGTDEKQLKDIGRRRRTDKVQVLVDSVKKGNVSWQDVLTEVCTALES